MSIRGLTVIIVVAFTLINCKSGPSNGSQVSSIDVKDYETLVIITDLSEDCSLRYIPAGWGTIAKVRLEEKKLAFEDEWKNQFAELDEGLKLASENSFVATINANYFLAIECPDQKARFALLTANKKYSRLTMSDIKPSTLFPIDNYTSCYKNYGGGDELSDCDVPNKPCELTKEKFGPFGRCEKIDFPQTFVKNVKSPSSVFFLKKPCKCQPYN